MKRPYPRGGGNSPIFLSRVNRRRYNQEAVVKKVRSPNYGSQNRIRTGDREEEEARMKPATIQVLSL
ncbi:hypothetical protein YC2023_084829 [Brassica napus]